MFLALDLDVARTSPSQVWCLAFTKQRAIQRHKLQIHYEDHTHDDNNDCFYDYKKEKYVKEKK